MALPTTPGGLPHRLGGLPSLALAVGAVAVAAAISMLARPWVSDTPFALFHLAVLVSAAIGGGTAGWPAVALSIIAVKVFHFVPTGAGAAVSLIVSGLVASAIVVLVVRLSAVRTRAMAGQRDIERLNRLYSALSQVNQAIVSSRDREELFPKVCRALVERGGFRMAWVGWHDTEAGRLVPVASAGDAKGYLDGFTIHTDDSPEGRGPTGTAFREDRPYIANDLYADASTLPWRARAEQHGFRASSSFPVRRAGKPCATLSVYAAEVGFFRAREIALLEEAARDISFALDNFAREEERQGAEADLRRSEERYHSTLDSILEGCQLIGHDWRYLYLNPAAAVHNRRPNAELTGRTVVACWPGIETTEVYAAMRRSMEDRVATQITTEFSFPDGHRSWFEVRTQAVPEGIFVLSIDVSDRHRAERALQEAKANLEHEVDDRTAELRATLVRAEAADRTKSAFLATMSHELRTPLNSIIGFTGIMLQGLAGPLNPEQSKQLGMVRGSARHLLELINDVLDISKIEAGQLEVRSEAVDLREAVERVVASVRPMAEQKGLTLAITWPHAVPPLRSDRRRLEQIVLNLLHNAVKFTDRGGVALTVLADVAMADGRPGVQIRVSDSGIGIRADELETLFQPFRQLDTGLARQHEGTGLGLAICRRLTDLLGGELHAESTWGVGSTFEVTFPVDTGA